FNFAKNLISPITFDSARLFTCITAGTKDKPTGAFDAAVTTKTNLLLGFWISPGERGASLDSILQNEMSALAKGFQKHGQDLTVLVIGLSIGSEDIYRWDKNEDGKVGVSAANVTAAIKKVRDTIASSDFAKYMKGKPIGHVDTAQWAVMDGADFYGMTAYPYWAKVNIAEANDSFQSTLEGVKQRANNVPVWVAEMGWPFDGPAQGDATASYENLQRYWTEVGCSVVGQYNTFWFELIKDSESDQPDWGMIDSATHQPRLNLACSGNSTSGSGPTPSSGSSNPSSSSSHLLASQSEPPSASS
ncbi:glycoside hydrolase, partial [Setomelanomma holmii]